MLNKLSIMLGQTKEAWATVSYQGLVNVITINKTFVYFHSKHGKDACLANDAIDSFVNPRA